MGFALCSLALLVLYGLLFVFEKHFGSKTTGECKMLFECIAGYGLGGSAMALFGRVGGGIYTKVCSDCPMQKSSTRWLILSFTLHTERLLAWCSCVPVAVKMVLRQVAGCCLPLRSGC